MTEILLNGKFGYKDRHTQKGTMNNVKRCREKRATDTWQEEGAPQRRGFWGVAAKGRTEDVPGLLRVAWQMEVALG